MDFIATLTRKNSLRSAIKELDVTALEKVLTDLADILSDVKEKEAAQEREEQARLAKIAEIREMMEKAGLDAEDLGGVTESKSRAKVQPKYRLIAADGKPHEWSGRGRKPVIYREYEERGGNIEDLKIA